MWTVRKNKAIEEQPVVFFGSEGSVGVVARNLRELLWMFAGGVSPCEAVESDGLPAGQDQEEEEWRAERAACLKLAKQLAPNSRIDAASALRLAKEEFPSFERDFMALIKH